MKKLYPSRLCFRLNLIIILSVSIFILIPQHSVLAESSVPSWIKDTAKWWNQGLVPDEDFISGLEFMIEKGIITVSTTSKSSDDITKIVPVWVKDTAGWWADGLVPDSDFLSGLEFMIEAGIIKVKFDTTPSDVTASLLQPSVVLEKGESYKIFWIDLPGKLSILLEDYGMAKIEVTKIGGSDAGPQEVSIGQDTEIRGLTNIEFHNSDGVHFINFSRAFGGPEFPLEFDLRLRYDEAVYQDESHFNKAIIHSPILEYPTGKELNQLPTNSNYNSFSDFVKGEYDYSVEDDESFLDYSFKSEMPVTSCPAPSSSGPTFADYSNYLTNISSKITYANFSPSNEDAINFIVHGGTHARNPPTFPPKGSEHNDNFCGISTFIHSMQETFGDHSNPPISPGVGTDPKEWDKVGDNIHHSNSWGTTGNTMEKNINKNYRDKVGSENGILYCAAQLKDISSENLENWTKDCDVKMLWYDFNPGFNKNAHWVNVVDVDGDSMEIQDYGENYDVTYDGENGDVDFSSAPSSSTTGKHLQSRIYDETLGNSRWEFVYFYAVCECDGFKWNDDSKEWDQDKKMPSKNSQGNSLNP